MVDQLALVLRAVGVSLAAVLVIASVGLPRRARWALVPMLLCLVAYLVRSAPEMVGSPRELQVFFGVGALVFPVAFWWLVHNAFEDRADVHWLVWAAVPLLLLAGL